MGRGSTVQILYDDTDITTSVMFGSASFEGQINAVPGQFDITLKDPDNIYTGAFQTGHEIRCIVDGVPVYGGYVMQVVRKFAFPADRTDRPVKTRLFGLRGLDYNLLLDKRVLHFNSSDFTAAGYRTQLPAFDSNRFDGDLIRNDLFGKYIDVPAGFDTTTYVDDVMTTQDVLQLTPQLKKVAWVQQGTVLRKQLEDFSQFGGQIFYFDAARNFQWHALENSLGPFGFSDVPGGSFIGFRELDDVEDGSYFTNDSMIWGGSEWASQGRVVFARRQNADSIAAHNRWQLAEVHLGEQFYKLQEGVNARAETIVNGSPTQQGDQEYGLRNPQWQCRLAWFAHDVPGAEHLRPGQLVDIVLYSFGTPGHPFIVRLPLRSMRITFPGLDASGKGYVRFDGEFAIQQSDPWTLWAFLVKQKYLDPVQPVKVADDSSTNVAYGAFGSFTPLEAADGARTVFSIRFPYIAETTNVFVNGIAQQPLDDYTETDDPTTGDQTGITFVVAPPAGAKLRVTARMMTSAT